MLSKINASLLSFKSLRYHLIFLNVPEWGFKDIRNSRNEWKILTNVYREARSPSTPFNLSIRIVMLSSLPCYRSKASEAKDLFAQNIVTKIIVIKYIIFVFLMKE